MGGMCYVEDPPGELGGDGLGKEPEKAPEVPLVDKRAKGLQAALTDERAKRQALEARLAAIETAATKAATAKAKKRGEFESLYNSLQETASAQLSELEGLRAKETARTEALKTSNAERLAALPEEWRDLADPESAPEKLSKQLARLEKRIGVEQTRPAGAPQTKPPRKGDHAIPRACKASAKHHRRDPKAWYPIWLKTREGRDWLAKQK